MTFSPEKSGYNKMDILQQKSMLISDGNWSPFFISSDAQEACHTIGKGICHHFLEHKSNQHRPVTVQYRSASLNKITLHDMHYTMDEGEAHIRVPDMEQIYLCELNMSGVSRVGRTKADIPFSSGEVYMINANNPHIKRWCGDGHQRMIKIHQNDINNAVERAIGMPIYEQVIFDSKPFKPTAKIKTLCDIINIVCSDMEMQNSFFGSRFSNITDDLLIDLIINTIPNNYSTRLHRSQRAIRPRHIRNAAEYIHSHYNENITLKKLVRVSGVSQRSLHAAFKKFFGTSPMKYLKNVRLDLVRLELKKSDLSSTSVTKVAYSYGFNHLSKFTHQYKIRFSELPSETLRNL